jgi:hypothetical protein
LSFDDQCLLSRQFLQTPILIGNQVMATFTAFVRQSGATTGQELLLLPVCLGGADPVPGADSGYGVLSLDHLQYDCYLFLVGPFPSVHATRFPFQWPYYSLFISPVKTGCVSEIFTFYLH